MITIIIGEDNLHGTKGHHNVSHEPTKMEHEEGERDPQQPMEDDDSLKEYLSTTK